MVCFFIWSSLTDPSSILSQHPRPEPFMTMLVHYATFQQVLPYLKCILGTFSSSPLVIFIAFVSLLGARSPSPTSAENPLRNVVTLVPSLL